MNMYKTVVDYTRIGVVGVGLAAVSLLSGCTESGSLQIYVKPAATVERKEEKKENEKEAEKETPFPGVRLNKNNTATGDLGSRVAALTNSR